MHEGIGEAFEKAKPDLERYARYRMRQLGNRAPIDRDEEDLLQDAMVVFLSKPFESQAPAVLSLKVAMKYLSHEWSRERSTALTVPFEPDSGEPVRHPYTLVTPERLLLACEALNRIHDDISQTNDEKLSAVVEARADGMRPQAIKQQLGLSDREYDAIRKRLNRILEYTGLRQALSSRRGDYGPRVDRS